MRTPGWATCGCSRKSGSWTTGATASRSVPPPAASMPRRPSASSRECRWQQVVRLHLYYPHRHARTRSLPPDAPSKGQTVFAFGVDQANAKTSQGPGHGERRSNCWLVRKGGTAMMPRAPHCRARLHAHRADDRDRDRGHAAGARGARLPHMGRRSADPGRRRIHRLRNAPCACRSDPAKWTGRIRDHADRRLARAGPSGKSASSVTSKSRRSWKAPKRPPSPSRQQATPR